MPATQRDDFIVPHKHSGDDVPGMAAYAVLPIVEVVGVTSDPTTTLIGPTDLTDMTLTFTPPSTFKVWEAILRFNGNFQHSEQNGVIGITMVRGTGGSPTTVPSTDRAGTSYVINGRFCLETEATVQDVVGGTSVTFRIQWNTLSGTATALAKDRRFSVELRPYVAA